MSKLPTVGTSIFSRMSQLATVHKAINLAQGFPDFPADKRLIELVSKAANDPVHQYAPTAGYPPLIEKIATLTKTFYMRIIDGETEVLITAGATQGIFTTITALVAIGDEVIVLDPSYDCYEAPILLCNATPIRISLNDDFSPNWTNISQACTNNTKMIIINNPHNPSGKIWTTNDYEQLEVLAEQFPNLLILADEVYEYITYENRHLSIHTRAKLIRRTIVASSFGKSLHVTGWKLGYLIAPEALMREIKKVHQNLVFSVNSLCQVIVSNYLELVDVSEISTMYTQKRNYFSSLLKDSRFELLPCEGTYFQLASYATISNEGDIEFCNRLVKQYGVAAIPISSFYKNKTDQKLIRFCFAKEDETLARAAQKLCQV